MAKRKVSVEEIKKAVERKEDMEASLEAKKKEGWTPPPGAVEKAREIDTRKKELDSLDDAAEKEAEKPAAEEKTVAVEELVCTPAELARIAEIPYYSHPMEFIRAAVRDKLEECDAIAGGG